MCEIFFFFLLFVLHYFTAKVLSGISVFHVHFKKKYFRRIYGVQKYVTAEANIHVFTAIRLYHLCLCSVPLLSTFTLQCINEKRILSNNPDS